jgi:hypothetical protein
MKSVYGSLEYEPRDFCENVGFTHYAVFNIIKYIARYKIKNGSQDLRKALDYVCYSDYQWFITEKNDKEICRFINQFGGIQNYIIICAILCDKKELKEELEKEIIRLEKIENGTIPDQNN